MVCFWLLGQAVSSLAPLIAVLIETPGLFGLKGFVTKPLKDTKS